MHRLRRFGFVVAILNNNTHDNKQNITAAATDAWTNRARTDTAESRPGLLKRGKREL